MFNSPATIIARHDGEPCRTRLRAYISDSFDHAMITLNANSLETTVHLDVADLRAFVAAAADVLAQHDAFEANKGQTSLQLAKEAA